MGEPFAHPSTISPTIPLQTREHPPRPPTQGRLAGRIAIVTGLIATNATNATAKLLEDPHFVEAILHEKMLKRIGTPADIAAAATFLCSDEANWITAADFAVDGGVRGW